jgi:hypothetical protein
LKLLYEKIDIDNLNEYLFNQPRRARNESDLEKAFFPSDDE